MDITDFSYRNAVAVTPHATNPNPATALYIGVSGDVVAQVYGSATDVTFKAVPVGILPVRVLFVRATGTTATNILALS